MYVCMYVCMALTPALNTSQIYPCYPLNLDPNPNSPPPPDSKTSKSNLQEPAGLHHLASASWPLLCVEFRAVKDQAELVFNLICPKA